MSYLILDMAVILGFLTVVIGTLVVLARFLKQREVLSAVTDDAGRTESEGAGSA